MITQQVSVRATPHLPDATPVYVEFSDAIRECLPTGPSAQFDELADVAASLGHYTHTMADWPTPTPVSARSHYELTQKLRRLAEQIGDLAGASTYIRDLIERATALDATLAPLRAKRMRSPAFKPDARTVEIADFISDRYSVDERPSRHELEGVASIAYMLELVAASQSPPALIKSLADNLCRRLTDIGYPTAGLHNRFRASGPVEYPQHPFPWTAAPLTSLGMWHLLAEVGASSRAMQEADQLDYVATRHLAITHLLASKMHQIEDKAVRIIACEMLREAEQVGAAVLAALRPAGNA
jgi:hypothetical protein